METTIPHYNATRLAWQQFQKAEKAYVYASNDYHEGGRRTNYQAEWVRPAAYDLSVRQAKVFVARAEYERKKKLFERVNKVRFDPIPE